MKKRMLMLVMSLCALTPALLGSAYGVENRAKNGQKQECEIMAAKRLADQDDAKAAKLARPAAGQKSIQ